MRTLIIVSFIALLLVTPAMAITINPIADTKIRDENPDGIYGDQTSITVANTYDGVASYKMYTCFDVSSMTSMADVASLDLYSFSTNIGAGQTLTVNMYGMNEGSLSEAVWSDYVSTATWNNTPGHVLSSPTDFVDATLLGTFEVSGTSGLHTFASQALTDFVNADTNGKVSLMFSSPDPGYYLSFHSMEAANSADLPALQASLNSTPKEITSQILLPSADTKIKDTTPDEAYGWHDSLTAGIEYDGASSQKTYIRFDVDGLTVDPAVATLRLFHKAENMEPGDVEIINVFGMIDGTVGETTWAENTMTWNNAPCSVDNPTDFTNAVLLGSFEVTEALDWYEFSSEALADFIDADTNGEITLMLSASASTPGLYGSFYSKEAANPYFHPHLEVSAAEVPEPSTMALLCLGMISLAAIARRRKK